MASTAVLLLNVGTPEQLSSNAVKKYLREFLNDARVVDLPALIRKFLVNFLIVPFRYKTTTHAYRSIWTPNGSPLLVISRQMQQALQHQLGDDYHVKIAMRYGQMNIDEVLSELSQFKSIIVVPLYPQYSSAATGSSVAKVLQYFERQWNVPQLQIVRDFYSHPGFINSYINLIKSAVTSQKIDHYIFSYHGLPENHVKKSGCHSSCDHLSACPGVSIQNQFCYRAQCFETSRLLAKGLQISDQQYQVAFQSRLGRTPWIKPYTDFILPELIKQNVKRIAVVCPSFVVDCLETLEEVHIRLKEQWLKLGGEAFVTVPCLNDDPIWIEALADLVRRA